MSAEAKSFLRYPGGKRRMLEFLVKHLPSSAGIKGKYVEPFVGGGVVYFSIRPKRAVLSDINGDLMDLYSGIRSDAKGVWRRFSRFGGTKTEYFRVRDNYVPRGVTQKAARILYLNRTCFKGMWRHNVCGDFNVGYGGQDRRWVIDQDNLMQVAKAVEAAKLVCADFESIIDDARVGDFIFADPPYRPGDKEQMHDHYGGRKFTFEDHVRLSNALKRASQRKARWALTVSSHRDILALYKGNRILRIPYGTGRKPGMTVLDSGEALVTNYPALERATK